MTETYVLNGRSKFCQSGKYLIGIFFNLNYNAACKLSEEKNLYDLKLLYISY